VHFDNVLDCGTGQSVALFRVHKVKGRPIVFVYSLFLQSNIFHIFELYELYFILVKVHIKFKPKIKFIKFELHNYNGYNI